MLNSFMKQLSTPVSEVSQWRIFPFSSCKMPAIVKVQSNTKKPIKVKTAVRIVSAMETSQANIYQAPLLIQLHIG